jgi:hypothetical protein
MEMNGAGLPGLFILLPILINAPGFVLATPFWLAVLVGLAPLFIRVG